MSIATVDMKHGMSVTLENSGNWEVLDRHPLNRNWWLHRWTDGVWETTYAHELAMSADVATLAAPIAESAKWTSAPFNIAHKDKGPVRKVGYVVGKWGAHKRDDVAGFNDWTITHLPTGHSVNSRSNLQETRALMEALATLDLPALDSSPFGERPTDAARSDTDRVASFLRDYFAAVAA